MTTNNSPVTMGTLMQFTEEVLLPAIERIFDEKLEEKFEEKFTQELLPMKRDIADIKMDINFMKKENYSLERTLESKVSTYRFERFKKFNGLKEELEK